MSLNEEFKVREARSIDVGYIIKTWLHVLHRTPHYRAERKTFFCEANEILLKKIMDKKFAHVMVVCKADDESKIVGFFVFWKMPNTVILWWSHVRRQYREQGIFKHVLSTLPPADYAYVFKAKHKEFQVDKYLEKKKFLYWPSLIVSALTL